MSSYIDEMMRREYTPIKAKAISAYGNWIVMQDGYGVSYLCPNCHFTATQAQKNYKYCPMCGKKMR